MKKVEINQVLQSNLKIQEKSTFDQTDRHDGREEQYKSWYLKT
jgi:hypothetical protein